MRKYLFNAGVISSLASGMAVVKATKSGPKDWRLALLSPPLWTARPGYLLGLDVRATAGVV